jgi:hypothetical protein
MREDGQLTGNIIVDAAGKQHELDCHTSFDSRIKNYVIGKNLIVLATTDEIAAGRRQTLDALRDILQRDGQRPVDVVGHWGTRLTEKQVVQLREWLAGLKAASN